jgi:hypothetical protein
VNGFVSSNTFRITPAGTITQILDASGDGAGHVLDRPEGMAIPPDQSLYVTGFNSDNAFHLTLPPYGCEVAPNAARYTTGDLVVLPVLLYTNSGTSWLETRLRLQLRSPSGEIRDLIDTGAGGGFPPLQPGSELDRAPMPLLRVQSGTQRGRWVVRCALEDPRTGSVQEEGYAPFVVQ